ncbi:hypothetical protein BN971_00630 [Mycobacterium bohemicum DSM 44277]|uniref:Uncharacterized protein n=1 Tax=Mycobacterium bohemicum DSM 44277 TaxID=1236609 RepID=A0A0U0W3H1_MYCBE|nr:hypothetical protein [Mycobacterium bohemicum]MCV6968719.1 hypothetical protein [Mycobacterium bohemicum]CPR05710.1 hypothetical protein BN971_00630 [Mycobacterium bohemicum DSM 44277]
MTNTPHHQRSEVPTADARHRRFRTAYPVFAGAAAVAAFALFQSAPPIGAPPVRLANAAIELTAPAAGPLGGGGFATDGDDDQEAQLQEQLAQQEMQQAQQQAEQQNEQAQQQAQQAEQQGQ